MGRGAANLTSLPPYDLRNVEMRVFPMRANMDSLQRMVDRYVNLMPPEIAEFRPSLPYVLLELVHYGRMATNRSDVGWLSQSEVVFEIPLDWYVKEVDGSYTHKGTASVSPFIFVDQPASQATGREVFGWPKVEGWPTSGHTLGSPSDPSRTLVEIETKLFPHVHEGVPQKELILRLDRQKPPKISTVPPTMDQLPSTALGRGFEAWPRLMQLMVDSVAQFYSDPEATVTRFAAMLQGLARLRPPSANLINLKQFRDAQYSTSICYQAIVNSEIRFTKFHAGGMLGDESLLGGDPSGGYTVFLKDHETLPILKDLGVEGNAVPYHDSAVAVRPDFPFWMDADMCYGFGQNICWRTRNLKGWFRWSTKGDTETVELVPGKKSPAAQGHAYDTARGPAIISLPGPWKFPKATLRVLPLPVRDPEALTSFCASYLQNNMTYLFGVPKNAMVYLLVWSYTGVLTDNVDVGFWASRRVHFSIPIDIEGHFDPLKYPTGLLSPFAFSDSDIGTTTARELYGWPTELSQIHSPQDNWMDDCGPDVSRPQILLELNASALQSVTDDDQMKIRPLMKIVQNPPNFTEPGPAPSMNKIWTQLQGYLQSEYSLKQFRDAESPEEACYQAVVKTTQQVLDTTVQIEPMERLQVRLKRYASQPIATTLGLVKQGAKTDANGVDVLTPVHPFWAQLDFQVGPAQNLWTAAIGPTSATTG